MFSIQQKRDISEAIQQLLKATNHPELPTIEEIPFLLHVDGAESWSWADIRNNGAVTTPAVNPWNELQARHITLGDSSALQALKDTLRRTLEQHWHTCGDCDEQLGAIWLIIYGLVDIRPSA